MATRTSVRKGGVVVRTEIPDSPKEEAQVASAVDPRLQWVLNDEDSDLGAVKFEIDGAPLPYYIAKLDVEGLTRIGLLSARNREGKLMLVSKGHFRGLLTAMLFVALRAHESGDVPLFEDSPTGWKQAYGMATATNANATKANGLLFAKILEVNPEILRDASKEGDEKDFLDPSGDAPEGVFSS